MSVKIFGGVQEGVTKHVGVDTEGPAAYHFNTTMDDAGYVTRYDGLKPWETGDWRKQPRIPSGFGYPKLIRRPIRLVLVQNLYSSDSSNLSVQNTDFGEERPELRAEKPVL